MMTPTLYHNDMSVCAQKVRLTLAEKGLDYEDRHLNLRAGDQKDPAYLKLNPNGYVPTLVHDDFVVCESTVICEYLDDAFPAPALKPADARGRARMRGFTKFIDAAIFPATGTVSMSIAFHHQYSPDVHDRMREVLSASPAGSPISATCKRASTTRPVFPTRSAGSDKMLADNGGGARPRMGEAVAHGRFVHPRRYRQRALCDQRLDHPLLNSCRR